MRQVKALPVHFPHIPEMRLSEFARPTIAVIENDVAFGAALQYALEAQGYAVSLFDQAQDALDSRQIMSADCLLIDIGLANGEGLEVLSALRRRSLSCPAIVIGAALTARSRQEAETAGAVVIEKPVMGESLNTLLRRVLANPAK